MRKVMPISIQFKPLNTKDTENRIQTAFNRIFIIAKQNLMRKKLVEDKLKQKLGLDKQVH